jgi:peptidoglycan hydrolase-like protein with peptidoglycan-binding domain
MAGSFCPVTGQRNHIMTSDTRDAVRLIQNGLEQLGHSPGPVDGLWGLRTARAIKALLAANGHAASLAPIGPLPWITEAKSALGRHEARDRTWLMDGSNAMAEVWETRQKPLGAAI